MKTGDHPHAEKVEQEYWESDHLGDIEVAPLIIDLEIDYEGDDEDDSKTDELQVQYLFRFIHNMMNCSRLFSFFHNKRMQGRRKVLHSSADSIKYITRLYRLCKIVIALAAFAEYV